MTLVKRLVKGSALTYAEADGNLDHFTDALALKADLEAELISGGETTVDGTTITVAAASWRVPPSVYAKVSETEFAGIAYSASGLQRYVAFFGTTSNTIIKVEGTEDETAVLPTQPEDTALISYALVGDASIGNPTQDLSGYQLKSDKSLDVSTDQASDIKYPSVKAVYDWAVGLFATIANLALKANIEATATTGVALTFTEDKVYGTVASPETGNITADVTGAKLGSTVLIIHNSLTEPTRDSKFAKLSGSGDYVTGSVNYIFCQYINSTKILYSISQEA